MEQFILGLLFKASLQIRTPRAIYRAKSERVHLRRLGRNFRAQHDVWWRQRKQELEAMNVGQQHPENTTLRWTPLGLLVTKWNTSVAAIVAGDAKQEWRFFGVRFRAREFGLMVRVRDADASP